MANIEKRITQSGKIIFRVKVRLKGFPTQTASFHRLTDARYLRRRRRVIEKYFLALLTGLSI